MMNDPSSRPQGGWRGVRGKTQEPPVEANGKHRLPPDWTTCSLNTWPAWPLLMCSCQPVFLHCPFPIPFIAHLQGVPLLITSSRHHFAL